MKVIVIKVFEAETTSQWQNIQDSDLKLISHQEIPFYCNTPRNIQRLLANLARFINERR